MKWPLQREAHAREDKVKKPDYREQFAIEGDNFDRGGQAPAKPLQELFARGKNLYVRTRINHPDFKTPAQKSLEHMLRREVFFKDGRYTVKLDWGWKTFHQFNNPHGKPDKNHHMRIKQGLEKLYAITIKQFRRAERETGGKEVIRDGRNKICYHFKSALVPANPVNLENDEFVFDIDFIYGPKTPPQQQAV